MFRDHLGTPKIAVDSQGEVTWKGTAEAFGNTRLDADNQIVMNLRFPGQYYDSETGTHYNYLRDYEPETGRYKQRDPLGLIGGLNPYSYGYANPNSYIDPTGEWGIPGAIYGAISGGVGGYISGGLGGAAIGIVSGAVVGAIFGPAAGSAAAGGVLSSLFGQAGGKAINIALNNIRDGDPDSYSGLFDPCVYDWGAIVGAGLGAAIAGPSGYIIRRWAGKPIRIDSKGIARVSAPFDPIIAALEGTVVGGAEYFGTE